MASSFYSNTLHVDFESVLAMANPGMVSVFNALMASGLEGFLGCPAVIYEAALVDFFNNDSDRSQGFAVQISLLLENIPNLELGESSEFPSSKILTERTIHQYIVLNDKVGAEEAADAPQVKKAPVKRAVSRKRPAVAIAEEPEAMNIQMIEPISAAPTAGETFEQPVAEDEIHADQPADEFAGDTVVEEAVAASVDVTAENVDEQMAEPSADVETIVEEFAEPAVEVTAEEIRPTSADDVDLIIEQVITETAQMGPPDAAEERPWFDLPYEDIMVQMDADRPVVTPSDTDEEVETMDVGTDGGDQQVQIFVEEPEDVEISDDEQSTVYILGVDEGDWYKASLPKIHPGEKGKEPLQLKDPDKGKPPQEHYSLICADIDLLVQLREQVIDEVANFFYSFSLKKFAQLQIDESYFEKEALVLSWAEAKSTEVSLQRKMYILLKYREVSVRKFLESWQQSFVPGEGNSAVDLKVIHMLSDLHSFIFEELKQQTVAHGLRWNKTCCSKLFEGRSRTPSAAPATTNFEVSRQRSYDDTLPPMSAFFKLMKKRSLPVVQPVYSFAPRQPTVFAFRLSQFCTVFIQNSLFSSLTTEDIRSFVGSIASERTVLRSVQSSFVSAVHPSVQLLDERTLSASTSDDSAMNFDETDTAATLPSLPAVTSELSTSLDDLRIFLSERFDNQAEATRHLDDAQSAVLSKLRWQTLDDVQTLRFNEFRKVVLAQGVSATADLLEVRKEIKALFAKVTSLDEQVAATRNDLLEFCAQAQQTLNIITDQLNELVAYINRGGNDKKGEVGSSRGPQPPPDNQNRESGNAGGDTTRSIVERLITADTQRQRERSRGNRSGSTKRRRF
ncbi:hypothetical protein F511_39973 [Dorcoceras hygrometricum]|uniref:Uncharacterized protein n=1 Tax=Dorcoceras hygrometricum TaxID=472368 RepID=A0A2Z7C0V3_9LAMI|nr:hypothetical protein F511_39973 [Dorcoceras hygrometricum]